MSCHYSCSSCSSPTYMYNCLACPASRALTSSTCPCSSGYYQTKNPNCSLLSDASYLESLLFSIADGLYWTNIALFWLYAVMIMCRVNSPKIRIVINFAQGMALLLHYPYLLDHTSKVYMTALSAFNFSYLFNLYTCTSDTVCTLLEYLWEPLLILPAMLVCLLVSFLLMNVCYRYSLGEAISFGSYWCTNWLFVLWAFLDFTAVILGYNVAKAVMLSYWGFVFVGLYTIGLVVVVRKFFGLVNTEEQIKVLHRARHNWAYGYDENYHLHFIDFLYTQSRKKIKQEKEPPLNTVTQNKNRMKSQQKTIQMFIPHSNLYLMQLFFKLTLGLSTALLYSYKPTFLIFSLVFLLNISLCWLGAFFYYDKITLLLYWLMSIGLLVCASCYWMQFFWLLAMGFSFLVTGVLGVVFIVLFFSNRKINDKVINRMFLDEGEVMKFKDIEDLSQEEMIIKNAEESQMNATKIEGDGNVPSQQQVHSTKREPFVGNLTRKTRPKPNQTIIPAVPQPQQQIKNKTKSKTIYKDMVKQEPIEEPREEQPPLIRHSKYQSKLSNMKTKLSARNRTKNVLDEPNNDAPVHLNSKYGDDFLSNVLEEPAEEDKEPEGQNVPNSNK